jgi:hypothetical protein
MAGMGGRSDARVSIARETTKKETIEKKRKLLHIKNPFLFEESYHGQIQVHGRLPEAVSKILRLWHLWKLH